jgi:hypothetical protein
MQGHSVKLNSQCFVPAIFLSFHFKPALETEIHVAGISRQYKTYVPALTIESFL